MTDRPSKDRRPPPFPDTPFEILSDSDWTKLDEPGRSAELKKQQAAMLARHALIVAGQNAISDRLDEQAASIGEQAIELKTNTEATKKNMEATERVEKNTEQIVAVFQALEGGLKVMAWIGSTVSKLAWVAIPLAALVGGWHAFKAWVVSGGFK